MFDDGVEVLERSVMHVGRAIHDIAQRRYLEGMLHNHNTGHLFAAANIVVRQPDVMEAVIGKVPAGMTSDAVADALRITDVIDRVLAMNELLYVHWSEAWIASARGIGIVTGLTRLNFVVARIVKRRQRMTVVAVLDIDGNTPRNGL